MKRLIGVLAAAAVTAALAPVEPAEADRARIPTLYTYTFASMPDWLNNDFGDVSGASGWEPGDPNSINPVYRDAIDTVLDDLAADVPSGDVLVAGDMVEGRWGRDDTNAGIFGPVGTHAERAAALREAAQLYYGQWVDRFTARGMDVFGAVGDHDIGDDPWVGEDWFDWKRRAFPLFKEMWAAHFTDAGTRFASRPVGTSVEDTAYATMLHPEVMLVTVDHFRRSRGDVVFELSTAQLSWLRRTLDDARAAGIDWVIVQAHNPVLRPVRKRHSTGGLYATGSKGEFWQVMADNGVDLYLAGEVHDTTVKQAAGLVQISHGGLLRMGHSMYLKGTIADSLLTLEAKQWQAETGPMDTPIWQTDDRKTIHQGVYYQPGPQPFGTLTMGKDGTILSATGGLTPDP